MAEKLKAEYRALRGEGVPHSIALDTIVANNPEINSLWIRLHVDVQGLNYAG